MAFSLFSVVDKIPKHPYFAPTTHTSYFLLYWSIKSKIQLTTSLSNYTPSWHFKVQAQTDTHTHSKNVFGKTPMVASLQNVPSDPCRQVSTLLCAPPPTLYQGWSV